MSRRREVEPTSSQLETLIAYIRWIHTNTLIFNLHIQCGKTTKKQKKLLGFKKKHCRVWLLYVLPLTYASTIIRKKSVCDQYLVHNINIASLFQIKSRETSLSTAERERFTCNIHTSLNNVVIIALIKNRRITFFRNLNRNKIRVCAIVLFN